MTGRARAALFALTLVSAAVCSSLGIWQLGRLTDRRAANERAVAGRALPELDLTGKGGRERERAGALDQRRVFASGTWDHANTFVLRARADRDAPGVHIVTPLRLDGRDEAVLVNRGFVPANDATRPGVEWDQPKRGTARGYAFLIPSVPDSGTPLTLAGGTSWRRLDLATVRNRLPYPVLDVYVHVTERETRADSASPWPIPARLQDLNDGPHFNYMVQWFMLAAASLAFGVIFILKREGERETKREGETPA
jgi:surfeit locus 1 family protein